MAGLPDIPPGFSSGSHPTLRWRGLDSNFPYADQAGPTPAKQAGALFSDVHRIGRLIGHDPDSPVKRQ
jgi:hypothetical protein